MEGLISDAVPAGSDPHLEGRLRRWERLLLRAEPGSFEPNSAEDIRHGRSVRDWVVDLAIFLYAVFSAAATTVNDHSQVGAAMLVIDAALGAAACLVLWRRRTHPIAVAWLAVAMSALSSAAVHAGLVAVFSAAVHARPRRAVQVTVGAIAATAIDCSIYTGGHGHHSFDWNFFGLWTATTLAALAAGSFVRVRRELVASLQERSRRLQSEQRLRVREARLAERTRIAREMHDVLAHRISLLNVHAGALEVHPDASSEQIARAARVIRMSARAAHEDLRSIIGVLRAATQDDLLQPPQPTTDDLPALVEESRMAGMEISFLDRLDGRSPPTLVGRTGYRVVQEALTNARKHAPAQPVSVLIGGEIGKVVHIEVVNRPASAAPPQPVERSYESVGSGTGLVGLAERVTLTGGKLEYRRLPDGAFRVNAQIPWTVVDGDPVEQTGGDP